MRFSSWDKNNDSEVSTITNTITVKVKGVTPITAETTFLVEKSADLMVTQTTDKSMVYVDDNLTYSVIVTNNGPSDATGVILTDILPQDADLVSVILTQGNYYHSDRLINCRLNNLASNDSTVVTITIIPKVSGVFKNFVRVTGTEHDPNIENNSSIETTIVNPLPPRCRGFSFF